MRRIVGIALALFATLGAERAYAGSYSFSVQVNSKETYSGGYNQYSQEAVSSAFNVTLQSDPSTRSLYSDPYSYYWYGGFSQTWEQTSSVSGSPFAAGLQSTYVGSPIYSTGGSVNTWSYGYYGSYAQFSMNLNGPNGYYEMDIYLGNYVGGFIDLTAPGAFDAFLQSLNGYTFQYTEYGSNNDGQTLYRGTAVFGGTTDVPEPSALLAIGAGLLAAGAVRRRRNKLAA